jgi:hypothetical protein
MSAGGQTGDAEDRRLHLFRRGIEIDPLREHAVDGDIGNADPGSPQSKPRHAGAREGQVGARAGRVGHRRGADTRGQ